MYDNNRPNGKYLSPIGILLLINQTTVRRTYRIEMFLFRRVFGRVKKNKIILLSRFNRIELSVKTVERFGNNYIYIYI